MFTGIIEGKGKVVKIKENNKFRTHIIEFPRNLLKDLNIGSSVSNNGCCLSITDINNRLVSFDLVEETLKKTNLWFLRVGDEINLERSVKIGSEVGGHLMSGHIISMAEIVEISKFDKNIQYWFSIKNKDLMKYIFTKGFIGIDGMSLTIGEILKNRFCVYLIPETISRTTIFKKSIGDFVNIEVDSQIQAIVDTVERIVRKKITFNKGRYD